ncbi:MAG TPA: hypothetical protein VGL82_12380 [Bryobacteraceae bacterium]|jgi:hypothetical protein
MKTHALRTSILALVLTAAGHAQGTTQLRADVPFNFTAGSSTLTAGVYTVEQGNGLIRIQSARGKGGAFLVSHTGQCSPNQTASRLVFHRYGDTYLLSQIWTQGNDCPRQVPVTRRERDLEARHQAPDETIILAIR